MKRRSGTGSVDPVQRADGTIEYYPRLPNRKRLDPWPTRELAEAALAEALHQIAEGRLIHTRGLTLAVWGRRCIERRKEDRLRELGQGLRSMGRARREPAARRDGSR
jgi:hypothetical protein